MSALDIQKISPIEQKVRDESKRTSLKSTSKDKKRFQRLRAAIKKQKKKNSGK